ncbi:MAG: four helix bundle protein [Bacteroidota bacterium]
MPIWQTAHELSIDVFKRTTHLPRSEDYGLTSQIRRSANSVSANVAEAFGRSSSKDKSNFYIYARGSVTETQNHLIYGLDVGYFEKQGVELLLNKYNVLIYDLNKVLKALSQPQP